MLDLKDTAVFMYKAAIHLLYENNNCNNLFIQDDELKIIKHLEKENWRLTL